MIRIFNYLLLLIQCIILLWLSCFSISVVSTINCSSAEREALTAFKQSLKDPSDRLSSWGVGLNCCQWHGITCDFVSGKVIKIDLQNSLSFNRVRDSHFSDDALISYHKSCLGGEISSSILQMKDLNYLDLSLNDFEGAPIPYFLGMLKNLRYLNLSLASFGGKIPIHLGNLSRLNYLDLSASNQDYFTSGLLHAESLHWLSGLSSLKYLDLGSMNLGSLQANSIHLYNNLSSLTELHLRGCSIFNLDTLIPLINLPSLKVLDLSDNRINSSLPLWLTNLTSLTKLDLSSNGFQGTIPTSFMKLKNLQHLSLSLNEIGIGGHIPSFLLNLCELRFLDLGLNKFDDNLDAFFGYSLNCSHSSLESLDLSDNELVGEIPNSLETFENLRELNLGGNKLWGSLPSSIGNLSFLQHLDVSDNLMNGTIPPSFGQLSELVDFSSAGNSWEAVITEAHLMNLIKLKTLDISTDKKQSFVFNVSYDWSPPFMLETLSLKNCLVGPHFSNWLRIQTRLTFVIISNAGISDTIPKEWISSIAFLDLSNNLLTGTLSCLLATHEVDSKNPRYDNLIILHLQNNLLSGPIPTNIDDLMPKLKGLYLSENYLNGTIPSSIQKMSYLKELSLSDNQLSGELFRFGGESTSLTVIDLANNNLSGEIPKSIGLLTSLAFLILSNNHLHGEIPQSLQNCPLIIIDVSENELYGNLPLWIGVNVSDLGLVNLRSNSFSGSIPRQWCNLPKLRILDLSNNNLSGSIPSCLYNLTAFINNNNMYYFTSYHFSGALYFSIDYDYYEEKTRLVMKGREDEYTTNLKYVLTIDLSRNRLSGEIPNEITNLISLGTLNLSNNDFVGSIPKNIGDLQHMETLDLSCNHLSGWIPSSLASLHFLEHLNLSFNNLTGRIPTGPQLQTLDDPSIYEGNPSLCGFPLQTKCSDEENTDNTLPLLRTGGDDEKNGSEMRGFYISMAIGFPVGLNILFFSILINKSWRASYFGFIDRVNYYILDEIAISRRRRRNKKIKKRLRLHA